MNIPNNTRHSSEKRKRTDKTRASPKKQREVRSADAVPHVRTILDNHTLLGEFLKYCPYRIYCDDFQCRRIL